MANGNQNIKSGGAAADALLLQNVASGGITGAFLGKAAPSDRDWETSPIS